MQNHRKQLLFILTGVALAAAFFLTYQRSPDTADHLGASVVEVKSDTVTAVPEQASDHLELTAENVVWFTNYYRSREGLPEIKESRLLDTSAQNKAADLFAYQYFDHHRRNGDMVFDAFIEESGYEFLKAGENLARGNFTTSRDVVDAWMASEGHRRNILDPAYRNIGVGIISGSYDGVATKMFVQHFAVPKTDCPEINSSLKRSIDEAKGEVADKAAKITAAKTLLDAMSVDDPDYNDAVNSYNALVGDYNDMVSELQISVGKYNKQVTRFEACLKKVL